METIKDLLLDIQDTLKNKMPKLWTDKDWGQLRYSPLPVKFPCALLDIESVSFSDLAGGGQMADVNVQLTVANQRLKPTSSTAPNKAEGYKLLETIENIHETLQMCHAEWYSPLVRKTMRKVYEDNTNEVYVVTYGTAFKTPGTSETTPVPAPPHIKIQLNKA